MLSGGEEPLARAIDSNMAALDRARPTGIVVSTTEDEYSGRPLWLVASELGKELNVVRHLGNPNRVLGRECGPRDK